MDDSIDELRQKLSGTTDKSEKIDLLHQLCRRTHRSDPTGAIVLAKKSLRLAMSLQDTAKIGWSMIFAGFCEYARIDYPEAHTWFDKALPVCIESANENLIAQAFQGKGVIYTNQGAHIDALEMLTQALEYAERSNDLNTLFNIHNSLGMLYNTIGSYTRALDHFHHCKQLSEQTGSKGGLMWAQTNIGNVCIALGEVDSAERYHRQSLAIAVELNDKRGETMSLANIGTVLQRLSRWDEALDYLDRALDMANTLGDRVSQAYILTVKGTVLEQCGEYEESLDAFKLTFEMGEQIGDRNRWRILGHIGSVHLHQARYDLAFDSLHRAAEGAEEIGDKDTLFYLYELLSQVYEAQGDIAESLRHHKLFVQLKEEVVGQQQQRALAQMEMRTEMERGEKEREILRLEKEKLAQEAEHKTRELASMALHLVEKNQFLDALRKEMSEVAQSLDGKARPAMKGLVRQVDGNINANDDWRVFEEQFENVHHDFLKRLVATYPDLTRMELKICALLKLNLSTKEIALMLASSERTINNHRYRLRKKLGLDEEVNLSGFFASI